MCQLNTCITSISTAFADIFISYTFYTSIFQIACSKRKKYIILFVLGASQGLLSLSNLTIMLTITSFTINLIIIFTIFEKKNILSKILYTLILTAFGVITEAITGFSITKIYGLTLKTLNLNGMVQLEGDIVSKLLLFLTIIIFKKFKRSHYANIPLKYSLQLMLAPIISILIIYKFIYSNLNDSIDIFIIIGILYTNFIVFRVYEELVIESELYYRCDLAEQQLAIQRLHYNKLSENRQEIIGFIHDYKNHLVYIDSLAQKDECAHIREYIGKLNANINQSASTVNSGHPVIDAVIEDKKSIAERTDIKFEYKILLPSKIYIDEIDMCILLGNGLDNAIEACNRSHNTSKVISIIIKESSDFFVIKIANSIDKNYNFSLDDYTTSKSNKKIHGFGLKNIRNIVDKYSGNMNVGINDLIFTLYITLQNIL